MFERRHYEAVAKVLYERRPDGGGRPGKAWANVCLGFMDFFSRDNPRFSRDRFLQACQGTTDRAARNAATRRPSGAVHHRQ